METETIDILLIEDDSNDLELTIRGLEKCGLAENIKVIMDGQDAIDFLFIERPRSDNTMENMPSLIILDLKLPRVNGLEILHRLKTDPQTKLIPVVVLTSSDEEVDVLQSYKLGVNSYITKPVDFAGYTKKISQLASYWMLRNKAPYGN